VNRARAMRSLLSRSPINCWAIVIELQNPQRPRSSLVPILVVVYVSKSLA